jgi:hypothetical protein
VIFLLGGTWAAPLAYAGCDPATIEGALKTVEQAFPSGDLKSVEESMFVVRKSMACVREPLTPALCSRVHRAYALQHWLENDSAGARVALEAMLNADPKATLPVLIVGERHPLRGVLVAAEEVTPSWVEAPGSGWVLVDGLRTGAAPRQQPYVFQPLKEDGRALGARLVDHPSGEGGGPSVPRLGGGSGNKALLRWTGVGLGVVSASLYGGAWATRGAYFDAVGTGTNDDIGRLHATTNGLAIGSLVTFGLGTGALVSAQLVR